MRSVGAICALGACAQAACVSAVLMGGETAQDAPPASAAEQGVVRVVAEPLFRDYTVPFEITGLLLLVAIVGTIVLARREAP